MWIEYVKWIWSRRGHPCYHMRGQGSKRCPVIYDFLAEPRLTGMLLKPHVPTGDGLTNTSMEIIERSYMLDQGAAEKHMGSTMLYFRNFVVRRPSCNIELYFVNQSHLNMYHFELKIPVAFKF